MTREEVNNVLRMMEQLRMNSYETETKEEEKEMVAEYGRLYQAIRPYLEGKLPYSKSS